MRMVGILIGRIAIALAFGMHLISCSPQGEDSSSSFKSNKPSISGTVSGIAATNTSTSFLASTFSNLGFPVGALTEVDGCQSGTYTTALLGSKSSRGRGSFSAGKFQVSNVDPGRELIITFKCSDGSTQRCLVKAGDNGVACNAVADGVLGALESALGKPITDSVFSSKPLSKIGSAIEQAAVTDSAATATFIEEIKTCKVMANTTEKATCYKEALEASPFLGSFNLLKTFSQSWTVDALFTYVVDILGAEITIDDIFYSGFGTSLGNIIQTDFVTATQAYIEDVVTAQLDEDSTYVTKIECQVRYTRFRDRGIFKYSPKMQDYWGSVRRPSCVEGMQEFFEENGFIAEQAEGYINAVNSGAKDMEIDLSWPPPPDITDPDYPSYVDYRKGCPTTAVTNTDPWNTSGSLCVWTPELVITSRYEEPNRNDPDGTREDFYERPKVELVSVLPELIQAMADLDAEENGKPVGEQCLFLSESAPPVLIGNSNCFDWFGEGMEPYQDHIGGLFGLYRYLKTGKVGNKLSLNAIHSLFTNSNLLNHRAVLRGNDTCGADIQGGGKLPALAIFEGENPVAQNGLQCQMAPKSAITRDAALEALQDAEIPYEASFKMFETIPSANDLYKFIYGASVHQPWNPTGPKQFWTAGIYEATGTQYPIFCQMIDKITGKPKETELDLLSDISCLSKANLTADPSISAPDANGLMNVPKEYPYVLINYGYHDDSKGQIFALADAKSGKTIEVGGNPILIKQLHAGNSTDCDETDPLDGTNDPGTIFTEKVNVGFGESTQRKTSKMYCLNMSSFQSTSSYYLYSGGMVSLKQVNEDGTSWDWYAPQLGVRIPNQSTLLPLCYFAHPTTPGITVNSTTELTSAGNGATLTSGELVTLGTSDRIDVCTNASSYSTYTKYYMLMKGGWTQPNRNDLKIGLIGSNIGARPLRYQNWSVTATNWEDLHVYIRPSVVETKYNSTAGGTCSNNCRVAPTTVQTPIVNVKLANQKWNPKFDPFCDDRNNNGKCDCYEKGTTTLKAPHECNLLDDAAEPTISQPLYFSGHPNAEDLEDLFNTMGGLAGSDLSNVRDANGNLGVAFNGAYLRANNLNFDVNSAFSCQFLATGETVYRTPKTLNWSNFGASNHAGCPDAAGSDTAGGPIRLVKPVAAANTFVVSRPKTLIKLINYATKTTGQGISIKKTEGKFTFDEALALVAFRKLLPASNFPVYQVGGEDLAKGTVLSFERVTIPPAPGDPDPTPMDLTTAVLRAILFPEEL